MNQRTRFFSLLLSIAILGSLIIPLGKVWAETKRGKITGLKIPRFVSLKSPKVHLRTGPGTRYPIEWILTLRNMPVEVIDEFSTWRKIRDWQGSAGWVHRSLLSGQRWVILKEDVLLYKAPKRGSGIKARLSKKVVGQLQHCMGDWCKGTFGGFIGWVERKRVWGVHDAPP